MSLIARTRKVHFVGVGGIGMSGLAELLLKMGHSVSGSDVGEGDNTRRLKALGAIIQIGHDPKIFENKPDVVVFSSAIRRDNVELAYAHQHGIPVIRRAEMLGELMRLKRGIGIAGSHGKTTTTGLVSLILQKANFDPTVVIGGIFDSIGSNVSLGKGDWLVAETDESDGSFLRLSPELAVVTNVDREHMDHYENFQAAIKAFADFIDRIPFYGKVILCADCPRLRAMSEDINKSAVWYGMEQQNSPDVLIKVEHRGAEQSFSLWSKASAYKECLAKLNLRVPGIHNILNATAAALVARELEVPWTTIATALGQFSGVKRRFEFKGHLASHPIIEDYAHHPTEIAATIKAALDCYQKAPLVLFQPHRYTRTRDQWEEFKTCFQGARLALTLEVYAASEPKDDWTRAFDREFFAQNIVGLEAHFFPSSDEMAQAVRGKFLAGLPEGTPILILGAGNIAARTLPILLSET